MSGSEWAAIIVGLISVVAAIFSGRAARSAAKFNSDASITNSRTQAETEAYIRARNMDLKTIEQQDKEIEEIRVNNEELRKRVRVLITENIELREENDSLRRRVARLEQLGENHG